MWLCLSKRHLQNDVSFFQSSGSMCGLAAKPSRSKLFYMWGLANDITLCPTVIYFIFVCNLFLLCEAALCQPLSLPHLQLLKQCSSVQDLWWDLEIVYPESSFAMMFLWHRVLCYICMVFCSWDELWTCCVYHQSLVEVRVLAVSLWTHG